MSMTPEIAQKLTDLRARVAENVRNDRPAAYGINPEEINLALSALRANRAAAGAEGGKVTKPSKGKTKKPMVEVDTKSFTEMDLD